MAGLSYAFSPQAGETPEMIARRRAVAEALLGQAASSTPRTIGEGLTALGAGIGGRLAMNRAEKAEAAGRASGSAAFAGLFGGEGGAGGAMPSGPGGNATYRDAIAGIESGGRYDAIGPTHPRLGRALGKYQVMEANIGPWSREVLGREVSADEFLSNPAIQDAIFDGKFNQYVQKYGPEKAARAWFGGPGNINRPGAKDVLGTTVAGYGQKFMKAAGGAPAVADALAGGGGTPALAGGAAGDTLAPVIDPAAKDDLYVPQPAPPAPMTGGAPMSPPNPNLRPVADALAGGGGTDTLLGGTRRPMGRDPLPQTSGHMDRVSQAGHDSLAPGGVAAVAQALAPPPPAPMPAAAPPPTAGAVPAGAGAQPSAAPAQPPVAAPAGGGAVPPPQPGQTMAQAPQGGQGRINQLLQAAANPWLSDGQRGVVEFMLKQELAKADPATQLEIQKTLVEIEKLKADTAKAQRPDTSTVGNRVVNSQTGEVIYDGPQSPTTDMQNYDAYAADERAAGREPLGRLEFEQTLKKAGAASTNVTVNGESLTPGRKKADEIFAEQYVDWVARGGYADVEKQIVQLEEAVSRLGTESGLSGPTVGAVPDWAMVWANPEAVEVREAVEEVVQRNLRLILGAQFTEEEGKRLIARAFNPSLSQPENAKRVRRLMDSIRAAAEAKQSASDFFAENGTIAGWEGKMPTRTDLEAAIEGADAAPASDEPTPEEIEAELKRRGVLPQ